jgi:hypothetical protein
MTLFFFAVAVVAVLFAMYWAQQAWGLWASLAVAFIGGVFIRFVPFPFGTLLAASAAVPVIYAARSAKNRLQGPPPGKAVEGSSVSSNGSSGNDEAMRSHHDDNTPSR